MKMSKWTPQILRYMDDASAETDYYSRLGSIIMRHAPKDAYICDAGCGMGQLSFELAASARRVDAVDVSQNAVSLVEGRALSGGYTNIVTSCVDFNKMRSSTNYDYMVFSLSASIDEACSIALRNGAKRLVVINKIHKLMEAERRTENPRPFTREGKPRVYDFDDTCAQLAMAGYSFYAFELSLDYGQPFRSLESAQEYFHLFRNRSYPGGISQRELFKLLTTRDEETFPYYLPITRHLALFLLNLNAWM